MTKEKTIVNNKTIESFIEESAKVEDKEMLESLSDLIPESKQGLFGGFSDKFEKKLDTLNKTIPKVFNLNLMEFYYTIKKTVMLYSSLYRKKDGKFNKDEFMENLRISIIEDNGRYHINLNINKKPEKAKNITITFTA